MSSGKIFILVMFGVDGFNNVFATLLIIGIPRWFGAPDLMNFTTFSACMEFNPIYNHFWHSWIKDMHVYKIWIFMSLWETLEALWKIWVLGLMDLGLNPLSCPRIVATTWWVRCQNVVRWRICDGSFVLPWHSSMLAKTWKTLNDHDWD